MNTSYGNLESGEFDKAEEVIDHYYSKPNREGFDDSEGITKGVELTPIDKKIDSLKLPIIIRKGSRSDGRIF